MSTTAIASYPLLFTPILKGRVWGGRTLARFGKSLPPAEPVGESWEIADLPESIPDGRSIVANGPLAGVSLRETLELLPGLMGAGGRAKDGGFPLLIKYLDAKENLSVQVHPSQAYADRHPESHLKCEAWYVMSAEPGAVIYKGLKPGVTRAAFLDHVKAGTVENDLNAVPVSPGDCHYLPSGVCHALGAGILVAEVQTPSDTTFRVWDWGREGRELHLDQALQCIDFDQPTPAETTTAGPPSHAGGLVSHPLLRTDYFEMERIDAEGCEGIPIVTNGLPEVWMAMSGSLQIESYGAKTVDVCEGGTVLIPSDLQAGRGVFADGGSVLRVTLPSPLRDMLAQG